MDDAHRPQDADTLDATDAGRALLPAIEAYYDAVPRSAARAEDLGPFTLFVNPGPGWAYYARPGRGATAFGATDVLWVRARQRELGAPESFEWVTELAPGLHAAAEAAGLSVSVHPLMALLAATPTPPAPPAGVSVRLVTPEDDLATIGAVAAVGFGAPGTAIGPEGVAAIRSAAAARSPETVAFERARLAAGLSVMAVAEVDGTPVAVGSHQPVGEVSEVAGVATVPAWRRRGIAAALTGLLVEDARRRGAHIIFLSAADDAVARVYARLGFRRIGAAAIAEPAG